MLVLLLETGPMITLLKWRREIRMGHGLTTFATVPRTKRIATLSHVEALVLVLMIFAAVAMARGYGVIS